MTPPLETEPDIQATLAALVEIDHWYDLERRKLDVHPEPIRSGMAMEVEQRHRRNRQPYVLNLARLHQIGISARMFGKPVAPVGHRRKGSDLLRTASRSKLQRLSPLHGTAQLNPGSSDSTAVTATEEARLGGADRQ